MNQSPNDQQRQLLSSSYCMSDCGLLLSATPSTYTPPCCSKIGCTYRFATTPIICMFNVPAAIFLGVSSLRWPPTHCNVSLIGMGCCRGGRKLLAICTRPHPLPRTNARESPTDRIPNRKPTTGGPKSHPSTPSLMTSPTPKATRNGTSQRSLSMSFSISTSGVRIPLLNTTTTASSTSGPRLSESLSRKEISSV